MRDNIDSLNNSDFIPFANELSHIEHYLFLEKLGFGDQLNFVFEITAKYFMVPTLTIQPIVENAIRHGIAKSRRCGTVTIRTMETESSFLISIIDDGAGFDVKEMKHDGISHIGVENVQKRLQAICGGSLHIESQIGASTTATITIPKGQGRTYECHSC